MRHSSKRKSPEQRYRIFTADRSCTTPSCIRIPSCRNFYCDTYAAVLAFCDLFFRQCNHGSYRVYDRCADGGTDLIEQREW